MATPAVGSTGLRSARPPGRLGSDDFNSGTLPIAQEAAVLYAANHSEAAVQALKAEIKDAPGRNNKQAWLMLFDLYQAAPDRQEFRRPRDALHRQVRAVAAAVGRGREAAASRAATRAASAISSH
jgi:hypothetical protein